MSYLDEMQEMAGDFNHYSGAKGLQGAADSEQSSFSIDVVRTGTSDGIITVPLFGALEAASAYNNVIDNGTIVDFTSGSTGGFDLTDGTPNTFTNKTIANSGKTIFEFSGGDTLEITADASLDYPSLIQATLSNVFKVTGFRMTVSDTTSGLTQFSKVVKVQRRSIFGADTSNSLVPAKYKDPRQFQSGIIDVTAGFGIDANTTMKTDLVAVAQTITFNFYVERSVRFNEKTLNL